MFWVHEYIEEILDMVSTAQFRVKKEWVQETISIIQLREPSYRYDASGPH